ncbi:hypothetical protein Vadar_009231 [Vaccinium darrowii]|uniref:Uncharacterized protein n=1 Tax=Vaccinium darrowii TaxID=229202 RepID=A0ACB7ZJJ4_9ERIC|nr:hypothetical protein Vadar_009231 [Vaccinium darrowii]
MMQSFRFGNYGPSNGYKGSSFTIYVDNLPNSVGTPWFRKFFSNFGFVVDSHLPVKTSRRTGNRFGFIRFDIRKEVDLAIENANRIGIGKRSLVVERASYDRGIETTKAARNFGDSVNGYQKLAYPTNLGDFRKGYQNKTFADALNQKRSTEWLTRNAVVRLINITAAELVQKAFTDINFKDVLVKHLGGMDMIVTFQSKEDRVLALNNPAVISWFKSIKPWNGEVTETMKEETFDVGRMLIATECVERIDECINITVRGRNHRVKKKDGDQEQNFQLESDDVGEDNMEPDYLKNAEVDQLKNDDVEPIVNAEVYSKCDDLNGDIENMVVKRNENVLSIEEDSGNVQIPKQANRNLETIVEDEVESFVDQTPDTNMTNQVGTLEGTKFSIPEQSPKHNKQKFKGQNQVELNKSSFGSKVITAKQKGANLRKEIRDICDSLDEGAQVGEVWEENSEHSDSINSEDILRRNNIIIKGFEEAVKVSKRLGVVYHESDETMINRMMQA